MNSSAWHWYPNPPVRIVEYATRYANPHLSGCLSVPHLAHPHVDNVPQHNQLPPLAILPHAHQRPPIWRYVDGDKAAGMACREGGREGERKGRWGEGSELQGSQQACQPHAKPAR